MPISLTVDFCGNYTSGSAEWRLMRGHPAFLQGKSIVGTRLIVAHQPGILSPEPYQIRQRVRTAPVKGKLLK
ncbi:hypothetical protein CKO51_32785 [Rhodopirellula sp. SM50]|nr:hypothetical protein CKO51_32785 [Rhodopirellula sp. SM50]